MKKKVHTKIVPPRWKQLATSFFLMYISWRFYFPVVRDVGFTVLVLPFGLFILASTIAFFRFGTHYAFCESYLEARFLWIPFRRIPWDKIEKATYLHVWKDIHLKHSSALGGGYVMKENTYEQIIYVTLKGCPSYDPKYQTRLIHNMLHPLRTACIFLPYNRKYEFLDGFKSCFPSLKMQPLDAWKTM